MGGRRDGAWLTPGVKRVHGGLSRKQGWKPPQGAEVGCSQSSDEPPELYFCMSHCRRRTMEGSLFAASLNSSREIWSSLSLSIFVKILSTRCWGVSPSWFILIMITVPTIL